jgi:uncharacterized protein YndB with AHSA1/START domain
MISEYGDSSPSKLILAAEFLATARELFTYFTKAELITTWWPQKAEIKPDGSYHFTWPSMSWHLRGRFSSLEFSDTLSLTWKWEHEPKLSERTVVLYFTENGDKTILRLEHGTYSSSSEDQTDRQSHLDGWMYFLPELQKVLS